MKRVLLLFGVVSFSIGGMTQNEDDALRYAQTYFGGTARNSAMAGAMTAIGGDFSVVTQNPAGLGRIMKTNFSATLNGEHSFVESDFLGTLGDEVSLRPNLSNLSYVKAYQLDPGKWNNWYGVQLGMGMTRLNSFNTEMTYSGQADSSILHSFIRDANGTPEEFIYDDHPFDAGLAFDVFAIDPAENNQYVTDFTTGKAMHERSVTRKGGMHEYSFSLSGNYANKLLVGASFNATRVKFEERFKHDESFTDAASLWLNAIQYTGKLETEGWGYSARAGLIYLPVDWVSIGLGVQLPTFYSLSDSWTNNMTAQTDDGTKSVEPEFVPTGEYDYRLKTPFKGNLSIGFTHKKMGMLGVEFEYVDYGSSSLSSTRFSEAPYSFSSENLQIENLYKDVYNIKIGGELKITAQYYARGGFALYDTPFRGDVEGAQTPTTFLTGGLGYNHGDYFLDLTMVRMKQGQSYFSYNPTINGSRADFDFTNHRLMLTFGLRF